jgi:2-keto-4-pentenoate hydratase
MTPEKAQDAARVLLSARGDHRPIAELPAACRPATVEDGYQVQDALVALWGLEVTGFKIGATMPEWQAKVGVKEPIAGRLFKPFTYPSPATLDGSAFHIRIVESEYGFRLGRDLPPREKPYSRAEVEDAVAAVHCCMELADSRYKTGLQMDAPSLIADNAIGTAIVVGPEVPDWRKQNLAGHKVTLWVDGKLAGEGTGAEAGGHPILPFVWLANDRAKRGDGLKAGMIGITSSCTGVYRCPSPATAVADFGAFGKVQVTFT